MKDTSRLENVWVACTRHEYSTSGSTSDTGMEGLIVTARDYLEICILAFLRLPCYEVLHCCARETVLPTMRDHGEAILMVTSFYFDQ